MLLSTAGHLDCNMCLYACTCACCDVLKAKPGVYACDARNRKVHVIVHFLLLTSRPGTNSHDCLHRDAGVGCLRAACRLRHRNTHSTATAVSPSLRVVFDVPRLFESCVVPRSMPYAVVTLLNVQGTARHTESPRLWLLVLLPGFRRRSTTCATLLYVWGPFVCLWVHFVCRALCTFGSFLCARLCG